MPAFIILSILCSDILHTRIDDLHSCTGNSVPFSALHKGRLSYAKNLDMCLKENALLLYPLPLFVTIELTFKAGYDRYNSLRMHAECV